MPDIQYKKILGSLFCWGSLPHIKYSVSPRLMHLVLVAHQMIWIILLQSGAIKASYTCHKPEKANKYCKGNQSFMAVYVIGGASVLVYFIYGVIHIFVQSSRDCRANWHYGFWFLKISVLFVLDFLIIRLDNLNLIVSSQFTIYCFGYAYTVCMIIFEFLTFWIVMYVITIAVFNQFSPKKALVILNFVGVGLFLIPLFFGLMALYYFDTNTTRNEIFWANLFISYATGVIYSIYNVFQNRNKTLLGGVFTLCVVFPTMVAMFHNDDKLYKTYPSTQTMYGILHVLEMIMGLVTFLFLVAFGSIRAPMDTENMVIVVHETESQCCCCVTRKEVEVIVPPGVEGNY